MWVSKIRVLVNLVRVVRSDASLCCKGKFRNHVVNWFRVSWYANRFFGSLTSGCCCRCFCLSSCILLVLSLSQWFRLRSTRWLLWVCSLSWRWFFLSWLTIINHRQRTSYNRTTLLRAPFTGRGPLVDWCSLALSLSLSACFSFVLLSGRLVKCSKIISLPFMCQRVNLIRISLFQSWRSSLSIICHVSCNPTNLVRGMLTRCLCLSCFMWAVSLEVCHRLGQLIPLKTLPCWGKLGLYHVQWGISHETTHSCRVLAVFLNLSKSEVFTALSVCVTCSCLNWTWHNIQQIIVTAAFSPINLQALLYVHHLCLAARLVTLLRCILRRLQVRRLRSTIRKSTSTALTHLSSGLLE